MLYDALYSMQTILDGGNKFKIRVRNFWGGEDGEGGLKCWDNIQSLTKF
jgi:hypothetical protein